MAIFEIKAGNSFSLKIGKENSVESRSGGLTPQTIKLTKQGFSFFKNGEDITYFETDSITSIEHALTVCPPISYIIGKLADAFCNGKIIAVTKSNLKPVNGLKIGYQSIVDRPNFLQNDTSFRKQIKSCVKAYGWCAVLKVKSAGTNIVSSMWALPNSKVYIQFITTDVRKITVQKSINDCIDYITYDGIRIDKENVYIFTDDTPYDETLLLPTPRLKPLKETANNLAINYKARGKLMNSPMGFISSAAKDDVSAIPLTTDEKAEAQLMMNQYGMRDDQMKFIVVSAAVSWQPMSFPINQMQFDVMEKIDTITVAEAFNYPPFLLGLSDKGIYNNVSEAKEALYNEAVIPYSLNYCQQLTECLNALSEGVIYIHDFSHVPALQKNAKTLAETSKIETETAVYKFEKGAITYNTMLMQMKEPPVEGMDLFIWQIENYKQQSNDSSKK